ncbi:MAG: hypothetical protein ACR2GY_08550 [Phycisphaerales bacterium]
MRSFVPDFVCLSLPLTFIVAPVVTFCLYNKRRCGEAFAFLVAAATICVVVGALLSGILTAAVAATLAAVGGAVIIAAVAAPIGPTGGTCPSCGYDLQGARVPGWPECGWGRT